HGEAEPHRALPDPVLSPQSHGSAVLAPGCRAQRPRGAFRTALSSSAGPARYCGRHLSDSARVWEGGVSEAQEGPPPDPAPEGEGNLAAEGEGIGGSSAPRSSPDPCAAIQLKHISPQ